MESLFTYSLTVSLSILALWLAYRLTIATQKHLTTNRAVLLTIYLISILIYPIVSILSSNVPVVYAPSSISVPWTHDGIRQMATILSYLSYTWLIGACACALLTLSELTRICLIIRRAKPIREGHRKIYITDNDRISPFSFGNIIVMNTRDYKTGKDFILAHEEGHISHIHTADMILAQLTLIICWYNPAAWILRKDLKLNHEYQADQYSLDSGCDTKSYQMFLLQRVAGKNFPVLANNLNIKNLKQRIAMINRNRSNGVSNILRYGFPLAAMVIVAMAILNPNVQETLFISRHASKMANAKQTILEKQPDIFVEGRQIEMDNLNEIRPADIQSITVTKNPDRIDINLK